MSALKNELSKKNNYYISKHRYLELQHHCLQYSEWKLAANDILGLSPVQVTEKYGVTNDISDPVAFKVAKRDYYLNKIQLINRVCHETNPEIEYYLLASVAHGYTYENLCAKYEVLPVGRSTWFKYYRKFFWLLDKYL